MLHKKSYDSTRGNLKEITNTTNIITTSFLKTEPETSNLSQDLSQKSQTQNIKQKELDEIMLRYLNLKTKLNNLWNKLD